MNDASQHARVAHRSQPHRASALVLAAFAFALLGPSLHAQTTTPTPQATTAPTPTPAPTPTTAPTAPTAQGGTLRGTVTAATTGKAPPVPLPGVAITATNTITGKKYATATAVDGTFTMAIPRNGRYVLRADFAAFAPQTQEVILKDATPLAPATFALTLASRAEAAEAAQAATAATPAAALARGLNSLRLSAGAGDTLDATANPTADPTTALPSLAGLGDSTESVAVSGQTGQTNALGGISEDDIRSRVEDAVAQARATGQLPQGGGDPTSAIVGVIGGILGGGGGFGGGGGRGGGGGAGRGGGFGGGAFRNFNPAQPHGSVFYQGGNSALDSAPWSPTLLPQTNPSAYSNRFGVTLAGSPYIPGLIKPNTKQFVFLNLTGQKNLNAFLPNPVRVPTDLERSGDFSNSAQVVNGTVTPVMLYDPATGQPLTYNGRANVLDPARRTAQALALLQYYPEPNIITADPTAYNYQTLSNAGSNNVAINARYVRQLGAATTPFGGRGGGAGGGTRGQNRAAANAKPTLHQNINIGYNFSHSASDQRNIFLPLGGATQSDGNGLNLGYTIGFGRLSNNATLSWNRNSAQTRNYFTDTTTDPSATAGIAVPNAAASLPDPRFYNGLPSLSITNFATLSNTTPSKLINQTISFSDFVSYRHKKHNYRFGFDIRRVHADSIGGDNPLGRFTFTGFATAAPASATQNANTAAGSGFADFLLGLPQSTQIQAGLYKIYLRENVYDAYAQDDFRVLANLTLNLGLRYEFFGPYTEKNNRLVNLDHNAGYTAFAAVLPNSPGPFSGQYNRSVVNPDNTMLSPRLGIAYKPKFFPRVARDTVIRGGYGINFNTGQYAQFARSLSHQAPFADTETNTLTSGCTTRTPVNTAPSLTLAHGFGCSSLYQLQNNFAVDRNYRLGVVQVYNLNLQRTVPLNIVLNLGYNGSYGNHLDFLGTPNANSLGSTTAGVAPFDLDTSIATSRSNQLVVSAQKRQVKGIALGATYTFQHAITNASGVGGVSGTPVQNFFNPAAEFGNASFDRRHQLTGNWVTELPFGPNRAFFNKGGLTSHLLDGFSLSGTFNFASGAYFTPQYSGSIAEAAAGTTYTQRPNRDYTAASTGPGSYKHFFNTQAFTTPGVILTGMNQLLTLPGTAAPNSIEGPGTVQVTASLSRTVPLGDTRSFEARVTATNVFNTVQYSGINTTQNSANFGQVTAAAAMRALQVQARYRF